jgi:DNA repair protein RecO (recombination protein O)
MEWEAPAIILDVRPYNEADALVMVMTEPHGPHRGLVRGGLSRRNASVWQPGSLIEARWIGRLADQLGTLSGELVHAGAAMVMDDPLRLAVLSSACAVAAGVLPEREPHPIVFGGLVGLVAELLTDPAPLESVVRWELSLLAELGYGLDLGTCAVTGTVDELAFVSPRSGRAVSRGAAGAWSDRLFPLPPFLHGSADDATGWRDGLQMTGHFLARDAFGLLHRPLPAARLMLYDRAAALAVESGRAVRGS